MENKIILKYSKPEFENITNLCSKLGIKTLYELLNLLKKNKFPWAECVYSNKTVNGMSEKKKNKLIAFLNDKLNNL